MEWKESLFPEWGGCSIRDYTNAVLYAVVSITLVTMIALQELMCNIMHCCGNLFLGNGVHREQIA